MTLLDGSVLARLERIQLATRKPLAGQLAGEHRSPRRGVSLDFADYREYVPGDDFRRIDFNTLARLDILLIKLFEADDDLTVRILLDTSGSMAIGGKFTQAQRLAAALGFVALTRRDIVTLQPFPNQGPPRRYIGRGGVPRLFADLEALHPDGPTTLGTTIARHLNTSGPPGLTILISDLLTPDWEVGVSRPTARGGGLVVIQVLDHEELEPETRGDLELVDFETTERVAVSLNSKVVDDYRRVVTDWTTAVATRVRQVGAAYNLVFAEDDIEQVLFRTWRDEGILR